MSKDLPEYTGVDGFRLAVVRNDRQFQQALQDVTVMIGKEPVADLMQTNPYAAQRKLPPGTMGVFIVVPQDAPNWPLQSSYDPARGALEILHTPKPMPAPPMIDYALVPKYDQPLRVTGKADSGNPFGPAAIFEIAADSLTGRGKGADPMLMLADMVLGALAASALQGRGPRGRMGAPAGIGALAQMLAMGDDAGPGQGTMWDQNSARDVVKLGRGLMREYPNTMFCGVGNSPSYLIYAMEKASANDNKPVEVRYIPFSGRFLESGRPRNGVQIYQHVDPIDFSVYEHYKDAYRTRLSGMGLSPTAVVARHQDNGTRTAFLDNTQSGTSFMTFNSIMRLWARDEGVEKAFKAAAPVIVLADPDCRVAPVGGKVSVPSLNVDLKAQVVRIPYQLRLAMNSNYSCESDRFVPEYPFEQWGKEPVDVSRRNRETIAQVKALIDAEIGGPKPEPQRGLGGLLNRLRQRGSNSDPHQ